MKEYPGPRLPNGDADPVHYNLWMEDQKNENLINQKKPGLGIAAMIAMIPLGYVAKKHNDNKLAKAGINVASATFIPIKGLRGQDIGFRSDYKPPMEGPVSRIFFAIGLLCAYSLGEHIAKHNK